MPDLHRAAQIGGEGRGGLRGGDHALGEPFFARPLPGPENPPDCAIERALQATMHSALVRAETVLAGTLARHSIADIASGMAPHGQGSELPGRQGLAWHGVFRTDFPWYRAGAVARKRDGMGWGSDHDAVRQVVVEYLEGMIWGDEDRLRRAFHPGALQVGHFDQTYEFFPLQDFIDWIKSEPSQPEGTPYKAELISIEVTGTVAVAKITDTCFGSDFTDYLVLVNDRPDAAGRWQIVTKAYHVHAGRGLGRGPAN